MNRFGDERNCTVTWPKRLDLHQLRRVFGFAGQKFMLTEPIKCLAIFIFFFKVPFRHLLGILFGKF